jgi:predicted acetyltransferase
LAIKALFKSGAHHLALFELIWAFLDAIDGKWTFGRGALTTRNAMPIEMVRAVPNDATTLANLLQYYVYDLTEVVDSQLGADGRFVVPSVDAYWSDAWRHPHLVRVDGKLAGFALVQQRSRITGDQTTWDVAEFFVMRRYRRQGVGAIIATRIFETFRGRWEVRERTKNHAAIAFWRRVIGAYTDGNYEETLIDDERWNGPVQSFRNGP